MNEIVASVFSLSAAATGALISAAWEGALLALLVVAVLRLLPGLSAAARSVIWLNVFVLLALLQVLPLATHVSVGTHAAAVHALQVDPRWSVALAAVWLSMSLFRAGQLLLGAVHLHQLGRKAVAVETDAQLQPLLQHNGHAVELCVSGEVARPSVLGFFRPRILVPPALLAELSQAELSQVILHEMEHLHRGDDWVNLLQKIALVLFPLNPALAWVERRLCTERELACDDRVLNSGSGRKAYALCLTHLAEFVLVRRGFSLVLGAWERRPELVRRVHRILSGPARSMGRRPAMAAMGSLTAGALACTLVLAHAPQIVRFAPLTRTSQGQNVSAALDARELAHEMGGNPQFVKAVIPALNKPQPARHAVCRRPLRKAPPAARLAELRMPPPPNSGTLLVMTEWNAITPPRVVVTFTRMEEENRRFMVIPATYAVVPTPNGWLVIQI